MKIENEKNYKFIYVNSVKFNHIVCVCAKSVNFQEFPKFK